MASFNQNEYYNTVYKILSFPLNVYLLITSLISICIEMLLFNSHVPKYPFGRCSGL